MADDPENSDAVCPLYTVTRLHLRNRSQQLEDIEQNGEASMNIVETSPDSEQSPSTAEIGELLEQALLGLPERFRTVVMLRDIEEMSTSETAAVLDLTEANVKVRLHRGHRMMRSLGKYPLSQTWPTFCRRDDSKRISDF